MATGSSGVLKYFRPVRSSSSSITPILPDPDGLLSERVPAEVKQSKESSRGRRPPRSPPRERCFLHYKGNLGLVF